MIIEERWRQQEQTNEDYLRSLSSLQATAEMHRTQLDTLWESLRADATGLLKAAQDMYETITAPIDEQLTTLRGEQQE